MHDDDRVPPAFKEMTRRLREHLGADGMSRFVDAFLLRHEARILQVCAPDNPGLIRLKELIRRRECGTNDGA